MSAEELMDERLQTKNPLADFAAHRPADPDARRWKREHFIPLRKADLVRLLAEDVSLGDEQRDDFLQLCGRLEATFHLEYHRRVEQLKDLYAPFNPDSVTKQPHELSDQERERMVPRLFDDFRDLLRRANYHRLTQAEIEEAVGAASDWGLRLNIDFGVFRRLEVFARGDVVKRRTRRRWRKLYAPETVEVPLYQRLVVMFLLQPEAKVDDPVDPRLVYVKLFKNIPKQDLDMLLPGTRFRMTLLDHGRIILPTLSGLGVAMAKVLTGAVVLAFASVFKLLAFVGFVGGTLGYGVKSFFGYLHTKDKYQLNLTRSLYYQNLDNNAGVLHRVLDEAEEQEFREAILAYALLRRRAPADGWEPRRLDREAEAYLNEALEFHVDFEVHDALEKLERLGCAERTQEDQWRAVPVRRALTELDQVWRRLFPDRKEGAAKQGT